jgi:hypothetical protein
MRIRVTDSYAAVCGRKLVDFEHHRLPEMDAHGIDVQVLSLTVPGIQADRRCLRPPPRGDRDPRAPRGVPAVRG